MSDEKQKIGKIAMQLQDILAKFVKVRVGANSKTELYSELGLAGDDVDDFLKEIEKQFSVSMKLFQSWKYFPDEGAAIMDWPFKLIGIRNRLDASNYQSMSFEDLAKYVVSQMNDAEKK